MGTGRVTERLRAVLDTNVFLSAFLSRSPSSPTREILDRWQAGEFILLVCDALVDELTEKLLENKINPVRVTEFLTLLSSLADWVTVPEDAVLPVILEDPDDDPILACAIAGKAEYLVTYDLHFEPLGSIYRGVKIAKALPFLWALRGDVPASSSGSG
jgi:putative PIN family toxin of toxin-antitoxin system